MPLFRHLIYKEILRVLNVTTVREYAPGEEIIKEGTPGDEMFVLLKGKLRLHKNDAFITELEPGAHIGEMALVDRRQPRSASATAEERARLLIRPGRISTRSFARSRSCRPSCSGRSPR